MQILAWSAAALVLIVLAVVLAGTAGLLGGRVPDDLGARDGRLKAPSRTPNSVTSQAALHADHPQRAYAEIEPIAPRPGEDGARTIARIRKVVDGMHGAVVVTSGPDYLY